MKTVTAYPGTGIDIAYGPDGQLLVATVHDSVWTPDAMAGRRVRLQRGLAVDYTAVAPGKVLARELRVAVASDGRVACIAQIINPDRAILYLDGAWRILPDRVHGQRCVAIWAIGRIFRWATVTAGTTAFDLIRIDGEDGQRQDLQIPGGTSDGILAVEDGAPVDTNTRRDMAVGGLTLWHAFFSGPWAVGEGTSPDRVMVARQDGYRHTVVAGNTSQPKLAVHGDTVAVGYSQNDVPRVVTLSPPYPVDVPAPIVIPPFAFPTAVAWFFEDSKRPSVTPSPAPGQWSILVEPGLRPTKPVLLGMPADGNANLIAEWADRWDQVRGIYVAEEGNRDELQTLAILARSRMRARGLPLRPIYSYSGEQVWADIAEIDYLGIQLYPLPNETAAQAEARWRALKAKAGHKPVWVVGGFYGRRPALNVSIETIRACVPVIAELAAEWRAVIGAFAWGRQDGAATMPELRPDLMVLAAAVVDILEEDDVINAPKVEFLKSEILGQDKTGVVARFRNAGNPEHGTIEVTLDEGIPRVEIVNAGGRDRSGKRPERRVL